METTTQWPLVANIRATARRCEAEDIGVSEKALRQWVKDGTLPSIAVGRSGRHINWDTLMDFLSKGSTPPRRCDLPYRRRSK